MKLTSILTAALLLGTTGSHLTSDVPNNDINADDMLYACALYPLCDLDIYSPVLQPTDKKIDTKDKAKDDKVA